MGHIAITVLTGLLAIAMDDQPSIREISTQDLKLNVTIPEKGQATSPHIVTEAAGLRKIKLFSNDSIEAIRKQIDFETEQVVVFWWAGSGQDKIAAGELRALDKKHIATFSYTPGKTRDLRAHLHLFAIPRGAEVKVQTRGR